MLSMTTDYFMSSGCPEPYLRRIAEAGFTHVHWCHQWKTDFLYCDAEIRQIGQWLQDFGLGLTDLHASAGMEKAWVSEREYQRQAGVELVRNRMEMTARLGSDVIIMHLEEPAEAGRAGAFWDQAHRTLDELEPAARQLGVRIALENGHFDTLERAFAWYGPAYIGLCYDSGHGNASKGLNRLEQHKDRLISVHLHDNDGTADQHRLIFSGTVDWPRLARLIAESSYRKWMSLETTMANAGIRDEKEFLRQAFETGTAFSQMVDACRSGTHGAGASDG